MDRGFPTPGPALPNALTHIHTHAHTHPPAQPDLAARAIVSAVTNTPSEELGPDVGGIQVGRRGRTGGLGPGGLGVSPHGGVDVNGERGWADGWGLGVCKLKRLGTRYQQGGDCGIP